MLLFFNISGGELLVIVVVVYLVLGPKKIPEIARMVGKGINELRRATNDIRNEINREINRAKGSVNIDLDDPLYKPPTPKSNTPPPTHRQEQTPEVKKTNAENTPDEGSIDR